MPNPTTDTSETTGGRSLMGHTLVMSGGSRGIGLAIAVRAAQDGANVALMAKTDQPHPRLEGTVHTAAAAIEEAGGQALPFVGDVRDEGAIEAFVAAATARFGRVDVVINNASVLDLSGSEDLAVKKYDLMQDVNVRGTFLLTRACIPHLRRSPNPHVLTLSPPLDLDPHWAGSHLGYTIAKYGMSLCTLGFAEEFADDGIAANSLWPRTLIATAAVENLLGGDEAVAASRTPAIVADAAHHVLTSPSRERTGRFLIDDEVLTEAGVADLEGYRADPDGDGELALDLFLRG